MRNKKTNFAIMSQFYQKPLENYFDVSWGGRLSRDSFDGPMWANNIKTKNTILEGRNNILYEKFSQF